MTKKAHRSRTLQTAAAAFVTSAVALILHYAGAVLLDPEGIGAAWTGVLSSAIFAVLRFGTSQAVAIYPPPPPEDPPHPDHRVRAYASVSVGILLLALVGIFIASLSSLIYGCASSHYTCRKGGEVLTRHPDGTVTSSLRCDGDQEAVVIHWLEFDGVTMQGYRCLQEEVPHGAP